MFILLYQGLHELVWSKVASVGEEVEPGWEGCWDSDQEKEAGVSMMQRRWSLHFWIRDK